MYELKVAGMSRPRIIRMSKVISAPLPFVYRWCTDFRDDDYKIVGFPNYPRKKILWKTRDHTIYVTLYTQRKGKHAVGFVTPKPPREWHLDFVGEVENEVADYKLTKVEPKQTRLDILWKEVWKIRNPPSVREEIRQIHANWGKYVAALEKDYAKSVRARA